MKFLTLVNKYKLKLLLNKRNQENQNEVDACILALLKPNSFSKQNLLVTSKFRYNTLFDSIVEYNRRLLTLNALLKNNAIISADWCTYEYRKVPYEDFFTNGVTHVDKQKELDQLKSLIIDFRQQLKIIDSQQVGVQGHNYRQMSRFHTHLSDLVVQLIKSSHEISLSKR